MFTPRLAANFLVVVLVCGGVVFGEPVASLSGPSTVRAGGWARLTYEAVGETATWVLHPDGPHLLGELALAQGGSAMIFLAAPGASGRTLVVLVVVDTEGEVAVAVHEITVGIVPGPGPGPGPPDPVEAATAVLVVFDEDTQTPQQTEVMGQLRQHFDTTAGVDFYAIERGAKDENGRLIAPAYITAAGVDPPCVVVYSKDKILWRGKLPATSAELIDKVDGG
jgi:hypothetical protein